MADFAMDDEQRHSPTFNPLETLKVLEVFLHRSPPPPSIFHAYSSILFYVHLCPIVSTSQAKLCFNELKKSEFAAQIFGPVERMVEDMDNAPNGINHEFIAKENALKAVREFLNALKALREFADEELTTMGPSHSLQVYTAGENRNGNEAPQSSQRCAEPTPAAARLHGKPSGLGPEESNTVLHGKASGLGSEESSTVYRYLCPGMKIGFILGLGGEIAKQLRYETGAKIIIGEPVSNCHERVVTIISSSKEIVSSSGVCVAQHALIRVHDKIVSGGAAGSYPTQITARLLVPLHQAGCLIGKGCTIIQGIRSHTGAHIRIISHNHHLPSCALHTDELLQIIGDASRVKKALTEVAALLHAKPSHSSKAPAQGRGHSGRDTW